MLSRWITDPPSCVAKDCRRGKTGRLGAGNGGEKRAGCLSPSVYRGVRAAILGLQAIPPKNVPRIPS